MKRISKVSDLIEIKLECNIISDIEDKLNILDDNYGENRNVDIDLGGYALVLETKEDVIEARKNKLQGLIPEYTDIIECSEGVNWTSSLFLLSSDFAIIVVTTEELSRFLLE